MLIYYSGWMLVFFSWKKCFVAVANGFFKTKFVWKTHHYNVLLRIFFEIKTRVWWLLFFVNFVSHIIIVESLRFLYKICSQPTLYALSARSSCFFVLVLLYTSAYIFPLTVPFWWWNSRQRHFFWKNENSMVTIFEPIFWVFFVPLPPGRLVNIPWYRNDAISERF